VRVTLRDGSQVEVRPIRPTDKALLKAGFERLSAESRHRRFLSPMPNIGKSMLRYLTEVDHHDHEALLAVSGSGEAVGVARYVRSARDPQAAETAVTVADDWQHLGLGTALLGLLAGRAREEGVRRFTALMLADNEDMLDVLRELGPFQVMAREAGTIEIETELPEEGLGPHLREMLRGTAAGRWRAAPSMREATPSGRGPRLRRRRGGARGSATP
jgi:GNAT superfamily N-acetyltransferase